MRSLTCACTGPTTADMETTVVLLLLATTSFAADSNNKNYLYKTDKRELLEGNYGERTVLKNVLRSNQGADGKPVATQTARASPTYGQSSLRLAKISDVFSNESPHYSTISDHLFSPISAYQTRSPTLDANSDIFTEPELKPKLNKKYKKPTSPPKRTYSSFESRPVQYDPLSQFANYDLTQFRNYRVPSYDRGVFTPRDSSAPAPRQVAQPSQYYPQVYQQAYQGYHNQRQYVQPVQYIPQTPQYPQPQQIPNLAYQGLQQGVYVNAQGVPGVAYQNQQFIREPYPQGQQLVPNVQYTQVPQQPAVTYPQYNQVQATIEPQTIRLVQQPTPQPQIPQPQPTQSAVSYTTFAQSLPPYSQQQYPYQAQPTVQYTQTHLLPGRPDVPESIQALAIEPEADSQPQPQQISDSQPEPTSKPIEEETTKDGTEEIEVSTEKLQTESSIVQSTTQPAPQEVNLSQPTQAPIFVTTEPSIVQQPVIQARPQVERQTYLPIPQGYPQNVYQGPEFVNGGVSPTFPPIHYFGNYAETLFRNYHL